MIRNFEPSHLLEPEAKGRMQWGAAFGAGLIAGVILLIVPRGSPWASLTFFSLVIMGRPVPPGLAIPLPVVWLIHLGVAIIYGLIISRFAARLTHGQAILAGGAIGLVLYLINFAVVSLWLTAWRGNEVGVAFTHLFFGLIAGAAYRGLLRRKMARG